ncbi:uncharacterized protein LOC117115553 [Anneissia japonica]|uniref:uncharacterized protein LOC117115553 n=1 Tax=Anneissia japonica TaxID=1529436 RepID=UPI0014257301|nr:uncharacterized protein LOC117115553 [Anneissia japonica]
MCSYLSIPIFQSTVCKMASNVNDNGYEYDALLWYHEDDSKFAKEMLRTLEGKNVTVYIEARDRQGGKYTLTEYTETIRKSRYIFLLISESTKSCGTFEFQMHQSLQNSLMNRLQNVIPVLINVTEVPDILMSLAPLKLDEFFNKRLLDLFRQI